MKMFDVQFVGEWTFNNGYEANSKEEALEKALHDVDREAFPFGLVITEQYIDEEKIDRPTVIIDY